MDYVYGLGLPEMFLSCCFTLTINQGGHEVAPTFGWESFAYKYTFPIGHCHSQSRDFPLGKSERDFSAR